MKVIVSLKTLMLSLLMILAVDVVLAQDEPELSGEASLHSPYVTLNIGVEMDGLERAANEASQGLMLIGESLQEIANHDELTPEQHQRIDDVLGQVEQFGVSLTNAMDMLPETVEQGMVPLENTGKELAADARRVILIAVIAIIIILLAAFAIVYYFVLAPGANSVVKTAKLLDEITENLKRTAEIVEISSNQNLMVMEEMRNMLDKLPQDLTTSES